jgi:hypothetical protein
MVEGLKKCAISSGETKEERRDDLLAGQKSLGSIP